MKTTPAKSTNASSTPKKPAEPRCDCRQVLYSQAALDMMEKATGQRFARLPASIKAPTPAPAAE